MEPIYWGIGRKFTWTCENKYSSSRGKGFWWQFANNRIINRVSRTTQFAILINVQCANKIQVRANKFANPITEGDSTSSSSSSLFPHSDIAAILRKSPSVTRYSPLSTQYSPRIKVEDVFMTFYKLFVLVDIFYLEPFSSHPWAFTKGRSKCNFYL